MTPVVPQQREVRVRAERRTGVVALEQLGQYRPGFLRERIIEMHARDGLHDAPVAQAESAPVDVLHAGHVRGPVLRDRNALITVDRARHAGCPEQLVADVAIDELVQVAEELGEFPGLRKGGRHQLDQRLGVVGGDVVVRERRPEGSRVWRPRDTPLWRHPERFLLDALQAPLQGALRAAVDQRGKTSFKDAVDGHGCAGSPCSTTPRRAA